MQAIETKLSSRRRKAEVFPRNANRNKKIKKIEPPGVKKAKVVPTNAKRNKKTKKIKKIEPPGVKSPVRMSYTPSRGGRASLVAHRPRSVGLVGWLVGWLTDWLAGWLVG